MGKTGFRTIVKVSALACCVLLVIAMWLDGRAHDARIARQHARDVIWLMRTDCNFSLKSPDLTNAIVILQKLQLPAALSEYANSRTLQADVESNRVSAIAQIIDSLRQRTGTNCGPDPTTWIMTFGDAQTRDRQQAIGEWTRDLTAENQARLKQLGY